MTTTLAEVAVPTWVSAKGGDCRAYDRRLGRAVHGPSHWFAAETDIIIENGLIQAWVGSAGLPPYLSIKALAGGTWHEVGCVQFGSSARELLRARVTKITPDALTLALTVRDYGEVFVTLKRGERMLRCSLPSSALVPAWKGTPPASRLVAAALGDGKFDSGLDGGGDDAHWADDVAHWADSRYTWGGGRVQPDLRLLWHQSAAAWSTAFWLLPDTAAADNTDGAGYLTIYDEAGLRVAECWLDATGRINFRMGASTVQSAVQTFDAYDELLIGLRFSTDEGMALSVRNQAGVVAHYIDADGVDPITSGHLAEIAYLQNDSNWGDGNWGDSVWGGISLYADGVIDNHMLFNGAITDAEFAELAAAENRLDNLPQPESRLVWYAPFDATPIPAFGAELSGRVEASTAEMGLTRAIAFLESDHLEVAAFLTAATLDTLDTPAAQHAQFAKETANKGRVR